MNTIQFIGLALFTLTANGVKVLLPDLRGFQPAHTPFIAFPKGTATTTNWTASDITVTLVANNMTSVWSYVPLNTEEVQIINTTDHKAAIPTSLPHIKYDCCHAMVLRASPQVTGVVYLPHGDAGCAMDNNRRDTVFQVKGTPLIIVATTGSTVRTLTFGNDAQIVIGNIPLGYLDGTTTLFDDMHFLGYYLLGDNTEECHKTPKADAECGALQACTGGTALIKFAYSRAADINCSNSQYP
jgi:hypothetical protein